MNFPDPNLAPLLIIDDDQDDAFLLRHRLRAGEIANPVIAFETCSAAATYFQTPFVVRQRPGLVFIDLKMPGAVELIAELRESAEWDDTKFVVLTYSNNALELANALHLRIDGYLLKFPAPEILAEFVRRGPWFERPVRAERVAHALCA